MKQPEALRLALCLEQDAWHHGTAGTEAATELRRLHEVNQELFRALQNLFYKVGGEHSFIAARKAMAKATGEKP